MRSSEIYSSNPSAIMSAAFHPPQQATEVSGGYRITGRGPLASNIHDAEWLFLTALVMEGDRPRTSNGMPEMIGLVMRASEARIVDTWYSLGMRATNSNDVVVESVFVPATRTFRLLPDYEPTRHFRGPLYRYPASGVAIFVVAPVPLAVARSAIGEVRELVQRKTRSASPGLFAGKGRGTGDPGEGGGQAACRAPALLRHFPEAWERTLAGERSSLEQKADLLLAGTYAATTAATVTDMMHRIAGTSGIYTKNPLGRHFRDAQTLRHHGFVSENRFEAVGQVYLGVPPEFAMVAF